MVPLARNRISLSPGSSGQNSDAMDSFPYRLAPVLNLIDRINGCVLTISCWPTVTDAPPFAVRAISLPVVTFCKTGSVRVPLDGPKMVMVGHVRKSPEFVTITAPPEPPEP